MNQAEGQTIGQRRLNHQRIAGSTFKDPAEAVSWLGAMQGQDYAGSLWALALRVPGTSIRYIERAIDDATIMRTWALRGTLHYVAPADIATAVLCWMPDLPMRFVQAGTACSCRRSSMMVA